MEDNILVWILGGLGGGEILLAKYLYEIARETSKTANSVEMILKIFGSKFLISPHTPEADKLLRKVVEENDLSEDEIKVLLNELRNAEYQENGKRVISGLLQVQLEKELYRRRRKGRWSMLSSLLRR